MKKINKAFSAATASLLFLSLMSSFSVSAAEYNYIIANSEEKAVEEMEKSPHLYSLEQVYEQMISNSFDIRNDVVRDTDNIVVNIIDSTKNENCTFYFSTYGRGCSLEASKVIMKFCVPARVQINPESLTTYLQEHFPDLCIEETGADYHDITNITYTVYDYDAKPFDGKYDAIDDGEEIYNVIKSIVENENDKIASCEFFGNCLRANYQDISINTTDDDFEVFKEYIDNNHPKFEPCVTRNSFYLNPTDEVTAQDWKNVYTSLYNDLDYEIEAYNSKDMGRPDFRSINLCKTDGDANTDNVLGIADATLILQYLTNKDEYDLTEQGVYNADLDKDGITALDALAIQQMLAERGEV